MTSLKHGIYLGLVFMTSFLFFFIVLTPAGIVTAYLPSADKDSSPRPELYGLWWHGKGVFDIENQKLSIRWELDWQGLVPGLSLVIGSGDVEASGWVGADWGEWRLADWEARLPAEVINSFLPQGKASGMMAITLDELHLANNTITAASGLIRFDGGQVSLGEGMELTVPPIHGTLAMDKDSPVLAVSGPEEQPLATARLSGKTLSLQVFRAFPLLLEMSEGGDASEVVFSTQHDIDLSGGYAG